MARSISLNSETRIRNFRRHVKGTDKLTGAALQKGLLSANDDSNRIRSGRRRRGMKRDAALVIIVGPRPRVNLSMPAPMPRPGHCH